MTAAAALLLLAVALAPLVWTLTRPGTGRNRREAALDLHRGQLAELDRDLTDGRIAATEHGSARLEVQRRLLAAADLPPELAPGGSTRSARWAALAPVFLVPVLAAGLYMVRGQPGLPAMPLSARMAEAERQGKQAEQLIATLRQKLAGMDQGSETARQGYVLLGNAEDGRGNLAAAAEAWRHAVAIRFEPGLAALAAEAQTQVDGGMVDRDSAELFARALAEAPPGAPWRAVVEKRLTQTGLR